MTHFWFRGRRRLLGVGVIALSVAWIVSYAAWKHDKLAKLETGSQLAQTERGLIEYARQGNGPAVLVLHGGLGGYDQGLLTAKAFAADTEFQFIAVSRPGYLRTPLATGKTADEQADAYAALLDVLNLRQVAVIAESGGGLSAIPFVLRHPERCWALVLLSANTQHPARQAGSNSDKSPGLVVSLLNSDLGDFGQWGFLSLLRLKPDGFVWPLERDASLRRRLLNDPLKLDLFLDLFESTAPLSHRLDGGIVDAQILADYAEYPLQDITCPTLIIHGAADERVPVAEADYAAQAIPRAEYIRMENTDHWALITHRDELVPQVVEFLKAQK